MGPFDTLVDEHDHILYALDVLELAVGHLDAGKPVTAGQLTTLVTFFRRYADACHHAKEEQVLFPALTAAGMPEQGGPVAVMLAEHVEGRSFVSRMANVLDDDLDAGRRDFVDAARAFSMLLRDHIRKENEVLFQIGRGVLPSERDTEVMADYERFEQATISPEDKQALVASISSLESELS